MKVSLALAALASVAFAAPVDQNELEKRQGGCQVGFVFARGSGEKKPIGSVVGPSLQSALKGLIPGLQSFPVDYAASMGTNASPQRTDQASINKGVQAFQKAANCRAIVAGGYSQGAAVMHNSVRAAPKNVQQKIAGVALFGDTLNKQENGHIKNFPNERSKVWCNKNDGVCGGQLNVNAGHMSYSGSTREAAQWLSSRVKAMKM